MKQIRWRQYDQGGKLLDTGVVTAASDRGALGAAVREAELADDQTYRFEAGEESCTLYGDEKGRMLRHLGDTSFDDRLERRKVASGAESAPGSAERPKRSVRDMLDDLMRQSTAEREERLKEALRDLNMRDLGRLTGMNPHEIMEHVKANEERILREIGMPGNRDHFDHWKERHARNEHRRLMHKRRRDLAMKARLGGTLTPNEEREFEQLRDMLRPPHRRRYEVEKQYAQGGPIYHGEVIDPHEPKHFNCRSKIVTDVKIDGASAGKDKTVVNVVGEVRFNNKKLADAIRDGDRISEEAFQEAIRKYKQEHGL